jgi:hypothetical protein
MRTIWIIDEDREILSMLGDIFEIKDFANFKLVSNWGKCEASPGDIVAFDMMANDKGTKTQSVTYLSHSSDSSHKPDFLKPDSSFTMIEKLIEVYNG